MKKLATTVILATLMATTALTQQVDAAPKKVKVTYVENGGKKVKDQTLKKNSNPKEPSISRSGYTFKGWYTDKKLTKSWNTKSSKVKKNTTLYAKWSAKTYTIKYDTKGGSKVANQKVKYNTNPKELKPIKDGYILYGWYTDANYKNKWDHNNGKVTKNMTLYVKWRKPSAMDSYRKNGFDISNCIATNYTGNSAIIVIPDGVTELGQSVFSGHKMITKITFPSSFKSIEKFALINQPIKEITLPNSLVYIGDSAFWNTNLTEVTIPDSVKTIGEEAFDKDVILHIKNNKYAETYAWNSRLRYTVNGGPIKQNVHEIENGVYKKYHGYSADVTIPEGVTKIGERAFSGNKTLKSVKLPSTLKSIDRGAFAYTGLTKVTIPNGVTSIGNEAFAYGPLEEVHIPSSVTYIGVSAFSLGGYEMPMLYITNNMYAMEWAHNESIIRFYYNGLYYDKMQEDYNDRYNSEILNKTATTKTLKTSKPKEQQPVTEPVTVEPVTEPTSETVTEPVETIEEPIVEQQQEQPTEVNTVIETPVEIEVTDDTEVVNQ